MRVYLAGPDVFLPDPQARGAVLKAICARHGLTGIFPLDALADEPAGWSLLPEWRQIALRNEAQIRRSDALIANLTPFRGPSADPGTVFELGFMRGLGRPVFGWSNDPRSLAERTDAAALGGGAAAGVHAARDGDGYAIESFGCADNLMIDGAVVASGGMLIRAARRSAPGTSPLGAFRRCVQLVADYARRTGQRQ